MTLTDRMTSSGARIWNSFIDAQDLRQRDDGFKKSIPCNNLRGTPSQFLSEAGVGHFGREKRRMQSSNRHGVGAYIANGLLARI